MCSIDYKVNEYCAKQIYECIENETTVPSETVENFIKSLMLLTKNYESIGPECEKLYYKLCAIESYPTGIQSMSKEDQYNFYAGAIYGIMHSLKDAIEENTSTDDILNHFKELFPISGKHIIEYYRSGSDCVDIKFKSGLKIRFPSTKKSEPFDVLGV